ncbi:MAG: septum formation initiator family protein [Rhizobiales bacterium]|nr:septum formation initiator family protein [Hyphomicrobiales bacterium]
MKWQAWLLMASIGLAAYFGYHAVHGSRGMIASREKADEFAMARRELAVLQDERLRLERRVMRLRPESLDPDLIDELARETLSMVEADDVIILLEPEAPLSEIGHR